MLIAHALSLLLHLHYLHALVLILAVIESRLLEIFLGNAQLVDDLVELGLDEHLFLLRHLLDDLFVESVVSSLESLSSLVNVVLFLVGKLCFSIKRTDLEDLQKLSEFDSATLVQFKRSQLLEVGVQSVIFGASGEVVEGNSCSNEGSSASENGVHRFLVHFECFN